MKKEKAVKLLIITIGIFLIIITGILGFLLKKHILVENEATIFITTNEEREEYVSDYYNEGWFDGYQQAREDLEKLEWCKSQEVPTMEDCLDIFLQEDYDFYYRAYRQGLRNKDFHY